MEWPGSCRYCDRAASEPTLIFATLDKRNFDEYIYVYKNREALARVSDRRGFDGRLRRLDTQVSPTSNAPNDVERKRR
jgi:hypothetical protein